MFYTNVLLMPVTTADSTVASRWLRSSATHRCAILQQLCSPGSHWRGCRTFCHAAAAGVGVVVVIIMLSLVLVVVVVCVQIHGTCLGFQLLHILVSNISRNDLLIETDSVAHPSTLEFTGAAKTSRFFAQLPVSTSHTAAGTRHII